MPVKHDMDSTTGVKLLRLFLRLMADRNRHFQAELAIWLNCSKQTIIRLMRVIESVVGDRLKMGMEDRRRWYQLCSDSRMPLGWIVKSCSFCTFAVIWPVPICRCRCGDG